MKILNPSVELVTATTEPERLIERMGRICYQSSHKVIKCDKCQGTGSTFNFISGMDQECYNCSGTGTDKDSAIKFVEMIKKNGHESVLEHASASFSVVCDRGVTHEAVRHRIASFSQESTRYCSSVAQVCLSVETEDDVVRMYLNGLSMRKISVLSAGKYTEWGVYKILEDKEIQRRPLGNRGARNKEAFKKIDSPEKAYMMGMFISDGSIRQDLSQVSLTQHKDYYWYLELMLRNILGGDVGVCKDGDCFQIVFSGKELGEDLFKHGFIPNKTYDTKKEDVDRLKSSIPKDLFPDFLRGLLDGDGTIRFFKQSENPRTGSAQLQFTGNRLVMEMVADFIKEVVGYEAKVRDDKDAVLSRVIVTNKESVVDLCRMMYKNFKMPYGHPVKCTRVYEEIEGLPVEWATWGDSKFGVICPFPTSSGFYFSHWIWAMAVDESERAYLNLRLAGEPPELARSVLPTCLKAEIGITANFREWRHFLKLRTSPKAHPQMRQIADMIKKELLKISDVCFNDL
jgi:thymidylate synthase ThyX